ncbi:MAG: hypothetical protein WBM86_03840, partial [Waterburya sp.]
AELFVYFPTTYYLLPTTYYLLPFSTIQLILPDYIPSGDSEIQPLGIIPSDSEIRRSWVAGTWKT